MYLVGGLFVLCSHKPRSPLVTNQSVTVFHEWCLGVVFDWHRRELFSVSDSIWGGAESRPAPLVEVTHPLLTARDFLAPKVLGSANLFHSGCSVTALLCFDSGTRELGDGAA